MAIVDWLWWVAGGGFVLGGLYLLWRALIADRARGRRRCKRCWYDMSGTPSMRCPECGREATREKQLFKTRRHWRLAALSILLLLTGSAAFFGREVHRHGWINATPSVAYIAFAPQLKNGTTFDELMRRVDEGALRQWEYRLLVHRCVTALRKENDPQALMNLIEMLQRIEIGGRNVGQSQPWASWALVSEIDHKGAIDVLVNLLKSDDAQVRFAAIRALGQFTEQAIPALPALFGLLASSDAPTYHAASSALEFLCHGNKAGLFFPGYWDGGFRSRTMESPTAEEKTFYAQMGECDTDAERARPILLEGLKSSSPSVRALSIYGLALLHPNDPTVQNRILETANDTDDVVRRTAIVATASFPFDGPVRNALRSALDDESVNVRMGAMRPVGLRGTAASMYTERVRAIMMDSDGWLGSAAAECFVQVGGDADEAIDAMLNRIQSPPARRGYAPEILDGLGRIGDLGVRSTKACEVLRTLMDDINSDTKSAAAVAYVKLGGEDLDTATRAIFEALYAKKDSMAFSRWLWFAKNGRISTEVMKEMLGSTTAAHRANAVRFLGEVGAPAKELLPEMRRLVGDPDPTVRQWADLAVRRVEYLTTHDR